MFVLILINPVKILGEALNMKMFRSSCQRCSSKQLLQMFIGCCESCLKDWNWLDLQCLCNNTQPTQQHNCVETESATFSQSESC